MPDKNLTSTAACPTCVDLLRLVTDARSSGGSGDLHTYVKGARTTEGGGGMPDQARTEHDGLSRREVLKRAAIVGGVAWAAPVVQSLVGTPAFAQGSPGPCFKSVGDPNGGGCQNACQQSGCTGGSCDGTDPDPDNPMGQGPCQCFCPSGQGGDNPCCNPGLCNPANYICHNQGAANEWAEYTGPFAGCPTDAQGAPVCAA